MTPGQVAVLFSAFRDWSKDAGNDEAADRELACLVLYPDGSGGIALDTPPGERPPTTWSRPDANVLEPERAVLDVHWFTPAEAFAAVGSPPPATSSAELAPTHAAALRTCAVWLSTRDRLTALEAARNLCRCAAIADGMACWERADVAGAGCPACVRRQDLTSRMRGAVAAAGAAAREVRRHLGELGLLLDADAGSVPSERLPRRRTRRAAR